VRQEREEGLQRAVKLFWLGETNGGETHAFIINIRSVSLRSTVDSEREGSKQEAKHTAALQNKGGRKEIMLHFLRAALLCFPAAVSFL
jgi:hypothetical protein